MANVRQREQPEAGGPSGGNPRLGETRPHGWRPVLRRADQAVVAGLVVCALVSMAVYWVVQGGPRGELIEIDRAEPLTARFLVDINQAEWPDAPTTELLKTIVFKASDLPKPPHDPRATPGVDAAERLLGKWLADGPLPYREILVRGQRAGLSLSSFYKAKRRLGVTHDEGRWALA